LLPNNFPNNFWDNPFTGFLLKIPEKATPVNREKIADKGVLFYAVDSFGKKYVLDRKLRKASPDQPDISQPDNT